MGKLVASNRKRIQFKFAWPITVVVFIVEFVLLAFIDLRNPATNELSSLFGFLFIVTGLIGAISFIFWLFWIIPRINFRTKAANILSRAPLFAVIVALVCIYLFIISNSEIGGTAMEPTLQNNEQVVLYKLHYYLNEPQREEIVVYKQPKDQGVNFISRIIAIGEDTIQIKEGVVYLNGTILQEPYVMGITMPSTDEGAIKEGETFKVPTDSIFVMSDNRQHASDSRNFGSIPKNKLVGKVLLRFWPADKFGLITTKTTTQTNLTGDDIYKTGLYFLNLKNITKAEELFTKSGTEYKYLPAFIELGNLYFSNKEFEKAKGFYQDVLEIEPENPLALHNMGYIYANTGNRKSAEEYLKKALTAYEKANNPDLKVNLEELKAMMKENGIFP